METSHHSKSSRDVVLTLLAFFLTVLGVAGCNTTGPAATAGRQLYGGSVVEQRARFEPVVQANCARGGTVNQSTYNDSSASADGSTALLASRLNQIVASARPVAVCGGLLRVSVFSRSIAETRPVVAETLNPGSGTQISRILAADKSIKAMVPAIQSALRHPPIDTGGTDIVSALFDAAGTKSQLSAGQRLRVLILTDGEQTVGPHVTAGTTPRQAVSLARKVAVPNLTGVSITFTGIGLTAHGRAPSTAYVEAQDAFWSEVCHRTHASCNTPTTNYVS